MKRYLFAGLIIAFIAIISGCFMLKTKSMENSHVSASIIENTIQITSRGTYSGIELSIKKLIQDDDVSTSPGFLRIVSQDSERTIIAITKTANEIQPGELLLSIKGEFKSIQELEIQSNTVLLEDKPLPSATQPFPDGISIVDAQLDCNSNGFFLVHGKGINNLGGSEIYITFDQSLFSIDTNEENEGVEALGTYASGLSIVQNTPGQIKLSTAFTGLTGKNMVDEDLYKVHVNTTTEGVVPLTIEGEVRDKNGDLMNVPLTGGTIKVGGAQLLGDFDETDKVDLLDFINFARNYGTQVGDNLYNELYDIAPAEDYYGGIWSGIYDKCNPDGKVNLIDFIIFARNYGRAKPIPVNNPPSIPSNPVPANNAIDVSLNAVLNWTCSDPDGDVLSFDVYFGALEIPPSVTLNHNSKTYSPGSLEPNTTYYWKIVAKDGKDGITEGPVWEFTAGQPVEIFFADDNLDLAIRDLIGKPVGPIYNTDVATISELIVESKNISDLSGIENLSSLNKLDLINNNISDLSPLSNSISLEWLRFSDNPINNISSLSGLTNLKVLSFERCSVSDISAISNMTKLGALYFFENLVEDLSPLASLTNLVDLRFNNNNVSDISHLSNLKKLRTLLINTNSIVDITALSGLTDLTHLDLHENQIADVSPLSNLTSLTVLNITMNLIEDIGSLANLANLAHFRFDHNLVSDISVLANMNGLELLFSGNNFLDYEDLLVIYNNPGIGTGDQVNIVNNYMVLSPESSDMQLINEMINRGVELEYEPQRHHPNDPANPYPSDGATEVELTPLLSWEGTDPDDNPLSFDLFIGQSATDLTLAATDLSVSQWQVQQNLLIPNETYYWKIISKENEHIYTEGPIWFFTTTPGVEITFADPNLEQAVRDAIDKPTGPIYLSDVTPLTELRANSRNIVNLSGIEALKNLQKLRLWDNSINDLSPISSLTELHELNLQRNNFSDLTPLAALTHIGSLAIDGNLVTDLSPIFGLSSLTGLFVSGNPIANLAQLEHFSWLYSFGINNLGVSDISFVEDFEKLRLLYFANNNVKDISPLLNTSIVQLNVGNNPITDVELLATMPWIKMLIAEGLGLTDIAFLGGLSDLWYLRLDNNLISDLIPLASLTKLEQLYIRNNRVSDLAAIANLPLLDWIQIENNRIGDLSPLANLARVRSINLNDNHISDVSPLVSNPAIDAGDSVFLSRNYLDLTPGSTDMQNIQALLDRGVNVYFSSQKSFPDEPTTPVPTNGETEVELTPLLSWEGTDPDGNPLTFDLFIGESATDLTLAATELDVSQWQVPENLLAWSNTYYWKVISKENEHIYTEGPMWSFKTGARQLAVPEMVLVEGGTFMMGDEFGDLWEGCRPVHQVTFTYDFWLGKYEVTFDEYDAFCDATGKSKPDDYSLGRGNRPVIRVSWFDAIAYCNWLSEKEGLPKAYDNEGNFQDEDGYTTVYPSEVVGYRLPTEAEWEYAARGGRHCSPHKYSGSDIVDEVAWYWDNLDGITYEVGQKQPNALGIYDMSGNVWEWCSDWWDSSYYSECPATNPYNSTAGSYRVIRGGSWDYHARNLRVAYRSLYSPTYTYLYRGFRITRTVP